MSNYSHCLVDKCGSFVLRTSRYIIILHNNDADKAKFLKVNHATTDAVKLLLCERPLDLNECGAPVDWIEDGRADIACW
jgi:hypothetical protein